MLEPGKPNQQSGIMISLAKLQGTSNYFISSTFTENLACGNDMKRVSSEAENELPVLAYSYAPCD